MRTDRDAVRPVEDTGNWSIEQLVERESAGLLAYFARRVSPVEDAADLLAETMLVLWRRADAVPQDPTAARMWAYGVARRVLATHRRGAVRRSALADRLRGELSTQPQPQPETRSERAETLHTALASLLELDQEMVRLVHWDGLSLVEVAGILGRRPGTVRSRYHRARTSLKRLMEAWDNT